MNVECWYLYLGSCCTFPSGMSTAQVHAAPRHSCTDTPIIYRIGTRLTNIINVVFLITVIQHFLRTKDVYTSQGPRQFSQNTSAIF